MAAEFRELLSDKEAQRDERPSEPREAWIPIPHWGFQLMDFRRVHYRRLKGRLLSQQRLAQAISAVVPCTTRHISQLEHSQQHPDDVRQLKRAMCQTIVLGLDPIWTRYNLRLTQWDCGDITINEALKLNSDWAKQVDHINRLLRLMPPRWQVEGAR